MTRRHRNAFATRKYQAKKKGVPFTITLEDMGDPPDKCPCCGEGMERGTHDEVTSSPSMDRLIPEWGYVPGNVIWVCFRCNRVKNDATLAEMYRVADFYWERFREAGIPCVTTQRPLPYESEAVPLTSRDRIDGEDERHGFSQPDNPNRKTGDK
jgi:hypothetical protein